MASAKQFREEARSLWVEVFGEPPSDDLDGEEILTLLFDRTAPTTYAGLSAALRSRNLTLPRTPGGRHAPNCD